MTTKKFRILIGLSLALPLPSTTWGFSDFHPGSEECFTQVPPEDAGQNLMKIMQIKTSADAREARNRLVKFIWRESKGKGVALPEEMPTQIVPNGADILRGMDPDLVGSHEMLVIKMERERGRPLLPNVTQLTSKIRFYHPTGANDRNRLFLFHHGHGDSAGPYQIPEAINFLLKSGFHVLYAEMPLYGINQRADIPTQLHDQFKNSAQGDFNPVRVFLEPVVIAMNYAQAKYKFKDHSIAGLSGGGWTTTLIAAIDERWENSFPIAGSLPEYIRQDRCSDRNEKGDFEQRAFITDRDLAMDYLDFYVLGGWSSQGDRRKQIQVLIQRDDCCFFGVRYRSYSENPDFNRVLKEVGSDFSVSLDTWATRHTVSPEAVHQIIGRALGIAPYREVTLPRMANYEQPKRKLHSYESSWSRFKKWLTQ